MAGRGRLMDKILQTKLKDAPKETEQAQAAAVEQVAVVKEAGQVLDKDVAEASPVPAPSTDSLKV